MKNNGAVKGTISTVAGEYTVPQGYHDGSGKVSIDATEQAKLIATNIREGVTILGVEGAMSGSEDMKPQSKEVTPSKEAQTIMPDEEYNCLSQVTVKSPSRIALNNHELNPIFMSEILPQKSHLIIREWNVFFLDSLYFFNGIVCKLECSRIVPIYKFVFNSIVEHLIEERLYLILH